MPSPFELFPDTIWFTAGTWSVSNMKYLAAYLLLSLNHPNPTKDEIIELFESVGITADCDQLNNLFKALEGKDINWVGRHHSFHGHLTLPSDMC